MHQKLDKTYDRSCIPILVYIPTTPETLWMSRGASVRPSNTSSWNPLLYAQSIQARDQPRVRGLCVCSDLMPPKPCCRAEASNKPAPAADTCRRSRSQYPPGKAGQGNSSRKRKPRTAGNTFLDKLKDACKANGSDLKQAHYNIQFANYAFWSF